MLFHSTSRALGARSRQPFKGTRTVRIASRIVSVAEEEAAADASVEEVVLESEPEAAVVDEDFVFNYGDAKRGNTYDASEVQAAIAFYSEGSGLASDVNAQFVSNPLGIEDAALFDDVDNNESYETDEYASVGISEAAPKSKQQNRREMDAEEAEAAAAVRVTAPPSLLPSGWGCHWPPLAQRTSAAARRGAAWVQAPSSPAPAPSCACGETEPSGGGGRPSLALVVVGCVCVCARCRRHCCRCRCLGGLCAAGGAPLPQGARTRRPDPARTPNYAMQELESQKIIEAKLDEVGVDAGDEVEGPWTW